MEILLDLEKVWVINLGLIRKLSGISLWLIKHMNRAIVYGILKRYWAKKNHRKKNRVPKWFIFWFTFADATETEAVVEVDDSELADSDSAGDPGRLIFFRLRGRPFNLGAVI